MLKSIMSKFIREKFFSSVKLKDIRSYYIGEAFKLSLTGAGLMIPILLGSHFFKGISAFSEFFALIDIIVVGTCSIGLIVSLLISIIFMGEAIFSSAKEKRKIEEGDFKTEMFKESKNGEIEKLKLKFVSVGMFTGNKLKNVLSYPLSEQEINTLIDQFEKYNIKSEELKSSLKKVMERERKDFFSITIEDFYLLVREIEKNNQLDKQKEQIEKSKVIIDNIFAQRDKSNENRYREEMKKAKEEILL